MGSNPTLSASKIKASGGFTLEAFFCSVFIFDIIFDIMAFIGRTVLHT